MNKIKQFENRSKNCYCQKCNRKIKVLENVYKLNNNLVNICEKCKEVLK